METALRGTKINTVGHKDIGHTTEECITLKDEIEKLIRCGYLQDYVNDRRTMPQRTPTRNSDDLWWTLFHRGNAWGTRLLCLEDEGETVHQCSQYGQAACKAVQEGE